MQETRSSVLAGYIIENQDLEETTVHQLVVGYIVKGLVEADVVAVRTGNNNP